MVVDWKRSKYNRSTYQNWELSGWSIDPNFKNISNLPTNFTGTYGTDMKPNNDGLSIKSGKAIDNGYSLEIPYSNSINSVPRPEGSGFDLGVYELQLNPSPPKNFRQLGMKNEWRK